MKPTTTIIIITSLAITAGVFLRPNTSPNTNLPSLPLYTSRCDTSDLIAKNYSLSIRDQIAYLCEQGLTKQEAINGMKTTIANPSINPSQAYRIVLLGHRLSHLDPLANH